MEYKFLRMLSYIRILMTLSLKRKLIQYGLYSLVFIIIMVLLNRLRSSGFLHIYMRADSSPMMSLLQIVYVFSALVFTSKTFTMYHRKNTSIQFLTLPTSNEEKYIGSFIYAYITNIIAAVIGLIVSFLFLYLIYGGWNDSTPLFSSPFAKDILDIFINTSLAFLFFFAGAVFFKRNQFFNTTICLLLIVIAFSILVMLYTSLRPNGINILGNLVTGKLQKTVKFVKVSTPWIAWGLGTLSIILGYFRFKKLQNA